MKFFPFFKGKSGNNGGSIRKKSDNSFPDHVNYLFNTFGYSIAYSFVTPLLSYKFYHTVSPLQGSIKKISSAISNLPLVLRSEDEPDKITKEADVLTLLNNPSELTTKKQFLTDLTVSLLLTREMWVIARGNINREPVELVFVHPFNIDISNDIKGSWPNQITVNRPGEIATFFKETDGSRFRYIDRAKLNELFPFVTENNDVTGVQSFRGISQITSLKDELLSYSASIVGNTASIENSGRPSGIISPKDDDLDEEQYEQLSKSLKLVEGTINNGKVLLLPSRIEAAFPQWAPKDMDYEQLQKNVKNNIWRLYSIPLPLVNEDGQTYSNFGESQTAFYDEAINQWWSIIADGLKWMLETRYDLTGFEIDYNQFEVPALKNRATQQMKTMKESQSLTTNEIRKSAGHEDIQDGDEVIVPANSTTLSSVSEGASFGTETPPQDGPK